MYVDTRSPGPAGSYAGRAGHRHRGGWPAQEVKAMHDCRVVVTAGRFGPTYGKGGGDPQRVLTGPARNARNSAGG